MATDQISHLTSDIVWMESQQIRLPDGSIDTVLMPKVYLAHLGDGAVTAGGALVTADGAGVSINVDGDIVNRGGVIDGGNGCTFLVSGQDSLNRGGTIRGGDVLLSAAGDVRNESLASTQTYNSVNTSGSYTALPNQASIVASAGCKSAPSGMISADGTRAYRFPTEKNSPFSTTGMQANFETYNVDLVTGRRMRVGNGHLNITK